MSLKAPFPYFGGKSKIAPLVWQALGEVHTYIEPFFGSGAVLLGRPGWQPTMNEIINDKDCYVANVWRAIQFEPNETARWCDWPTNHIDLSARKMELIRQRDRLREGVLSSPTWCDPMLAGYWIWAASNWIGSGLTRIGQIPQLTHNVGISQRPHLTGFSERGIERKEVLTTPITEWFTALSARLRRVKVTCGDWSIVCGGNWQDYRCVCGIFFDPPYSSGERDKALYQEESLTVAQDVARWAEERGRKPSYRIVLAGYQGEHEWLAEKGWHCIYWQTQGGYANQGKDRSNRKREVLWLSPHCQRPTML